MEGTEEVTPENWFERPVINKPISARGTRPGPVPGKKPGRKKGVIQKKIHWTPEVLNLVEKYAEAQCTDDEIATLVGTTRETFNRKKNKSGPVKDAYEAGRTRGRSNIRLQLYSKAKKGDIKALEIVAKSWFLNDPGWEGLNTKTGPAIVNNNLINAQPLSPEMKKLAEQLVNGIGAPKTIDLLPEGKDGKATTDGPTAIVNDTGSSDSVGLAVPTETQGEANP